MNKSITGSAERSAFVRFAAFIIIIAGLIQARSLITPFLLALFISVICAQPISWIEKKGVPGWLAMLSVILGLIIIFTGFSFIIGGTFSSFSGNLTEYETTLTSISKKFIQFLNDKGINVPQDQAFKLIQPAKILEFTAGALNTLFNMVGTAFLIFLTILFILMESGSFIIKAKAISGEPARTVSYVNTIVQSIRHYLAIKTLVCLAVGVLIYFALLIIGVDYPLLWALIAALMNYIPNIGSILAAIPTVLFALVQLGPGGAVWTLVSSMVIYNVLGNFLEPRIMGKGLGLSPLVVFMSLLFWGFVFGMAGMFLSVPLTMTVKIILEQNENTKWIAILLGTPSEAKIYLGNKELSEGQNKQT
jgi:AI-2 transport protein TqsA